MEAKQAEKDETLFKLGTNKDVLEAKLAQVQAELKALEASLEDQKQM